ncbi:MAG: UDP-N-acetylmuramyl-tripeptide synthetase [Planctomycetaceae bacterium]|jgi:UDP-N-acetylmuramoyl-L-alanyl-D-glutamate--2,6-diaminopimelate ligase|nr:UDP-N-acetylmuramyl-tripeptide synthetase [Planctomycetaceae bacterium]
MRACCKGTEAVSVYKTLKHVCKSVRRNSKTDVQAVRCCADADEVRPGDVFFALDNGTLEEKPEETLEEAAGVAVHNGCIAVVAQKNINGLHGVPVFTVPNVAECYAAFCQALYDYPAKSLKITAVTGTSGKTSVSYLIASILTEAGYHTGLISSLGISDGSEFYYDSGNELPPEQLAAWLYRMMMNGCTHAVIEVSSQCIAGGHLGGIQFDAVALTNIRKAHLDIHQSVAKYRRCKLDIFKYAKKNALAICNADDRITEAVIPLIDHPLLTAGLRNQSADVTGTLLERYPSEQTFFVTAGTETAAVRTTVIGDEHIQNCLTAAALCIGFDIDIKTVAKGIEEIQVIPGRMERIECGQDFNVFIDSASAPDSLTAVLRTLRKVTENRLICVIGAAEGLKEAEHGAFAEALDRYADCAILTAEREEYSEESAEAICNLGGRFADPYKATVIANRSDAVSWALTDAESGDTVLIIGNNVNAGSLMIPEEEQAVSCV